MTSLNLFLLILNHVVTEVVKAHFVVCAVCDIGIISLTALRICFFVDNKTNLKTEKTVKLAHPLTVTFCEIVIDCYDMNTFAVKSI